MNVNLSKDLYKLSVEIHQLKTLLSNCSDSKRQMELKKELKDLQLQAYFYLESLENSQS